MVSSQLGRCLLVALFYASLDGAITPYLCRAYPTCRHLRLANDMQFFQASMPRLVDRRIKSLP